MRKDFRRESFVMAQLTGIALDAPAVTLLSKYALDYAPLTFTAAGALPLPGGFRAGPRVEYRRRTRPLVREQYMLVAARVGRRLGPLVDLYVDGANLLDRSYSEISGVPMPGATMTVSIAVGR